MITSTYPIHSFFPDIVPTDIHQRTPVFLGSSGDVQDIIDLYKKHGL